jgi:hypothetical protein
MAEENEAYYRSRTAKQLAGDVALTAAFNKVADAVNSLINSITQTFSFVDKTQKASLALGQTLTTTRDRLGDSMDGLRGSIEQKLTAGIMTLDEGLRGNNAGVARLINQQMLTGTAYAGTAKAFSKLQNTLGLSNDQTNRLAGVIVQEGNRQGVATDVLVNAIESLKNDFGKFRVLGLQDVPEIMAMGVSRFGKANAEQFSKALGFLLDTSQKALAQRAALGIAGIDEQIRTASSTSARFELAINAINQAGTRFSDIAGRGSRTFDAFNSVIGPAGTSLAVLAEAGQQAALNLGQTDYSQQLAVRFDEALNAFKEPLMEIAIDAFPYVLAGINILGDAFGVISDWFMSTYQELGGFDGMWKAIRDSIMVHVDTITSAFKMVAITLAIVFLPPLISTAIGIVTAFAPVLLIVGAVVGALMLIDAALNKFAGGMDLITVAIDTFKGVWYGLIGALSEFISMFSWMDDSIEDVANSLRETANKGIDEINQRGFGMSGKEEGEDTPGLLERLTTSFDTSLSVEQEKLKIERDSNNKLEDIEANTRETITNDFQERSYQSIAESIDRILGIDANPNARLEELLEDANLIAAANLEKDPTTNIQQGALA